MRSIGAVIFDLDGTLINSAPDIALAVNLYLTNNGWPEQDVAFIEQFIGHGPRRLLIDVFKAIGHPRDDLSVDKAHLAYLSNYRANPAANTEFFPHVREDLLKLSASGLKLGICTNKPHEMTERVLEALDLSHLFSAAIGADAVRECKPSPLHLLEVAKQMNIKQGEYVYVGDTAIDQQTAQSAKVPFFAVPWGGGAAIDMPSSYRLSRLSDIPLLITQIESAQ